MGRIDNRQLTKDEITLNVVGNIVNPETPTQAPRAQFAQVSSLMPALLIAILLLAAGLRFHKLDAQSFWNDEGNSARLSERALPSIIEGTASDVHPPLYYVILRGWRELMGDSEFGLRSFSAFSGILTVAATIAIARLLFIAPGGRVSAGAVVLASGLLAAVNPTLVYYSQETRMYALLALLAALSTLTLLRWLNANRRWPWAIAYVVLTTAGLYTHYFYPTILVLQALVLLFWIVRKDGMPAAVRTFLSWLIMVGVSFIFYLPWMPVFLRQTSGRSTERAPILDFVWDSVRWMTFGETVAQEDLIWVTIIVILMLVWAVLMSGRRLLVPLLGVLLPVLAMVIAGTTNPAFFKFMIVAIPFISIWLAGSLAGSDRFASSQKRLLQFFSAALLIPLLGGMAFSLNNLYSDPAFARADYRGMAAAIAAAEDVNAGVILDAPNQWEVFTYYHREGAQVYPLPKGQPDPQILEPELAEIAARHDRLYALYWGEEQRDPQRVVEHWLDQNTFKASENWVGDVRFAIYATVDRDLSEQQKPLNIIFGDKITLHSFAVADELVSPGDIVQVMLSWSAAEPLEERYKVFLHLVDGDGQIVAQQDSEPVGGMTPTTTWQPGVIVVDNQGVILPRDLAPGEYDLLVGLYRLDGSGERLTVQSEPVEDYWLLDTIKVE